jgi:integrase
MARRVLAKILADIAAGKAGLPVDPVDAPTLEELAQPWLERRAKTHRDARGARSRWRLHLGPALGKLRPNEVDVKVLRRFIEDRLAHGLNPTSVGHCIRQVSTWFADLIEAGHAASNPIAALPRSARRLYASTYDTRSTPFLERVEDVKRVYLALPEPINVAFACGAFAGLRTGEVLGLSWEDIDLGARRIRIHQQLHDGRLAPLKDDEPRLVMLQDSLAPVLTAYKLATGGQGLLFTPIYPTRGGRPELGSSPSFIRPHTLNRHLRLALKSCGLPPLTWYEATRHTFASLFVLGGGSLEMLRTLMGHSSVTTTERYSHLRPDLFPESAFRAMTVDLSKPSGAVVQMARSCATMATAQQDNAQEQLAVSR